MDISTSTPMLSDTLERTRNAMDLQGLDSLKTQAREDQKAALRPVAEQFEAIFLQQILKESRNVSFDDGWLDGEGGDVYKDLYDSQLAQNLSAKGSLGFADLIVEQLTPQLEQMTSATKNLTEKTENSVADSTLGSTQSFLATRTKLQNN